MVVPLGAGAKASFPNSCGPLLAIEGKTPQLLKSGSSSGGSRVGDAPHRTAVARGRARGEGRARGDDVVDEQDLVRYIHERPQPDTARDRSQALHAPPPHLRRRLAGALE